MMAKLNCVTVLAPAKLNLALDVVIYQYTVTDI